MNTKTETLIKRLVAERYSPEYIQAAAWSTRDNNTSMTDIGNAIRESMLKELRRLQRELNGQRLGTYILGDQSEEQLNRFKERESKLARFHEILAVLNTAPARPAGSD